MRRLLPLAAAVVLAAGTACIRTAVDPVTGRMDVDVESPTQQGEQWTATMTGQGTGASLTGRAVARVIAGTTNTTLTLAGGTIGGRHPWHIHRGSCGSGGPIVGEMSAYPPIAIGNEGSGSASSQITLQLNEAERYHVNVHASEGEMATVIACGDLRDE